MVHVFDRSRHGGMAGSKVSHPALVSGRVPLRRRRRQLEIAVAALLVALTGLVGEWVSRPLSGAVVTYCARPDGNLSMYLFGLDRNRGPAPVVLYVHGGAWSHGDALSDIFFSDIVKAVTGRNMVLASIDYRLAPQHPFPAQLDDVDCALSYLGSHAGALGIDASRIAGWGGSAGGHLVALAAERQVAGSGVPALSAVVDWFGPTDLNAFAASSGLAADIASTFGALPGSGSALLRAASPADNVHAGMPPFMIVHGLADGLVPFDQSTEFEAALRDNGVPSQLLPVEHADHAFYPVHGVGADPGPGTIVADSLAFLQMHL